MKTKAVIGAGFGDEGKGKTISWLVEQAEYPLVVRFSGGHQAGHKVVINDDLSHVFANFGSGTLQGAPTYWSKYCTVEPIGLLREHLILREKDIPPKLFIDRECPVTTPLDIKANQLDEKNNKHGSCCVGYNRTIQREIDGYRLCFADLFNPKVFIIKMKLIRSYYANLGICIWPAEIAPFFVSCLEVVDTFGITMVDKHPKGLKFYSEVIFEGSQGLLLDQHFGFFPHVTRANTGTKNILSIIEDANGLLGLPEIFLVSRCYQTRHGAGPMTNEGETQNIMDNPYEHNSSDGFQGLFRKGALDIELLRYAIDSDSYIRKNKRKIVLTCMDLMMAEKDQDEIVKGIKSLCDEILFSYEPTAEDMF